MPLVLTQNRVRWGCGGIRLPILGPAPEVGSGDLCHIIGLLKYFFDELLLYWLEALSLIGHLCDAIHIPHDVQAWLAKVSPSSRITLSTFSIY